MPKDQNAQAQACVQKDRQRTLHRGGRCRRRQSFQNSAVGYFPFSRTAVLDASQFAGEPLKIGDLVLDFPEMVIGDAINAGTFQTGLGGEIQEIPELFEREAEIAAASNELQSVQMFLAIRAVISFGAQRRRHELDLLVISDGHNLDPGRL